MSEQQNIQSMTIDGIDLLRVILDTINSKNRHLVLLGIMTGDIRLRKEKDGISISPVRTDKSPELMGTIELGVKDPDKVPEIIDQVIETLDQQAKEANGPDDFIQRIKLAFSDIEGKPN